MNREDKFCALIFRAILLFKHPFFPALQLSIKNLSGFMSEQTLDQKPKTSKASQEHLTSCELSILTRITCQYTVMSREKQAV